MDVKVELNYDSGIEKIKEVYKSDENSEVIYIKKNDEEWMGLSLEQAKELSRKLMVLAREIDVHVGNIIPFHLQSDEYRKSTARAMREE